MFWACLAVIRHNHTFCDAIIMGLSAYIYYHQLIFHVINSIRIMFIISNLRSYVHLTYYREIPRQHNVTHYLRRKNIEHCNERSC